MAPAAVALNGLEGLSPVAGLFKCSSLTICAAFYEISTDSMLALSLGDSLASYCMKFRICSVWSQTWTQARSEKVLRFINFLFVCYAFAAWLSAHWAVPVMHVKLRTFHSFVHGLAWHACLFLCIIAYFKYFTSKLSPYKSFLKTLFYFQQITLVKQFY